MKFTRLFSLNFNILLMIVNFSKFDDAQCEINVDIKYLKYQYLFNVATLD